LSGWKSLFLSFGGRLILLKSILTSLSVYTLSFFKAPSSIISSIDYLLIKFFLGRGGGGGGGGGGVSVVKMRQSGQTDTLIGCLPTATSCVFMESMKLKIMTL
jgi:hypothetical protein